MTALADHPLGIVVPVYRGAALLHRSLDALARQERWSDAIVAVVVNDGRGDSLDAAQAIAPGLRRAGIRCEVLTSDPGRWCAFNAAEEVLPRGPRLYLDQDAALSPQALGMLQDALGDDRPRFVAPTLRTAASDSAWSRAFYRAWSGLPYVRDSPVTVGAFGVSEAGRRRWGAFPRLHSDDKFVRLHFRPDERVVVPATYEIVVPSGPRELVRARRRYLRGNREVELHLPRDVEDLPRWKGAAGALARDPRRWPDAAAFLSVYAAAAVTVRRASR